MQYQVVCQMHTNLNQLWSSNSSSYDSRQAVPIAPELEEMQGSKQMGRNHQADCEKTISERSPSGLTASIRSFQERTPG
jgi:hypothetical protein